MAVDRKRKVRVAVVGAGRWAVAHHIPGLVTHPCGEFTAVAEPSPVRRREVSDRFGVRAFATVEELVSADVADAVVIASPAATHYDAARISLDAGLDVFVEKPMTVRPVEASELAGRAERLSRHLMVGFTFQFTRHATRAREIVAEGAIGELQLVEVTYASAMRHLYEPGRTATDSLDCPLSETFNDPELAGGGQAVNQATHVVASMLATSGLSVARVSAHMRSDGLRVDIVDAALLEFETQTIGTLVSTGNLSLAQEPRWRLRYFGSKGILSHDLRKGTLSVEDERGRVSRETDLRDAELYPAGAPAMQFLDVITGQADNPATGTLGARTVEVIAAMYSSAAAAGAPIEVRSGQLDGPDK